MKHTLTTIVRITIVAFVTATLSMQHGTFFHRTGPHAQPSRTVHLG